MPSPPGSWAPCLKRWQPQPRSRGKGRHTKRPAKRLAQQVGNIKKWPKKAAENRKCVERADAPPERTACSLKNCIFSSQKPRFSALKCGKCVKKCVTGKKKNRLNPVFKRLFVCFHLKNDFFAQARGKKLRFHAVFRRVLICVFSHFPKKMWKTMWAVSGRGAGRFKAAAPSHTLPPHCAPHHFPWNPPGAAG